MSAEELKNKLENKEDIILVDCREQHEWDKGHINSAILIPMSEFTDRLAELDDKKATIVVQCRIGQRSLQVCYFLESEGYENLFNLSGGITDWEYSGYPVEI